VQLDCSLRKSDESTGLELQGRIDSSRGRIPMIFITTHNDDLAVRVQALKAGP
jgi:FixJ family two-component response regulator